MATKSDRIRELAREGLPVKEIARAVEVRYQHARKVLLDAGLLATKRTRTSVGAAHRKPPLTVDRLVEGGFQKASGWGLNDAGQLELTTPAPKQKGVYAKVIDGRAMYVGLANSGLASRFNSYAKPGPKQPTSQRLNGLMRELLGGGIRIDVYFAFPEDTTWHGLPVSTVTGLEQGLIETYDLPWNIRGS